MFVRARASSLLDSHLSLLANDKRFGVLSKALAMIILTGSHIDISTLREGARAGWGRSKVNIWHFSLCSVISALRAVGARTSCLLDSRLTLLTDSERLDIPAKLITPIIVLARSDIDVSTLSKSTRPRG